ncbi:molybdopterin cofactor-binding domain-containing protein [Polynucleobacter necessarius]|uniref:molybdopterin cofactor-binding domain-containing protein n=1 Tax=Polynucleobacter necessarius TaxID=576610 RepID=UPI001E3BBF76|nr:molybdopterin cofactor-binding domain-containing protein [Polynucleobacter necessarius]
MPITNPDDRRLTVYHSQQAPHMMQDLYCRQFGLSESDVHVICKDVGGPYKHQGYRSHLNVVFQNKTPTCQYLEFLASS